MKTFTLRLHPGQDLKKEIIKISLENKIQAGFILTCVGSLKKATLRTANEKNIKNFKGKFEIVSLVGTLSQDGAHLHISLSDKKGFTIGGHLKEGCHVYTTAEIVIGELSGVKFSRKFDNKTGFKELEISEL